MGAVSQDPILSLQGITKSFGAVMALKDVSFALLPGEVHTLCGENGAGKSTLINVLCGALQPDGGKIIIDGSDISGLTPADALRLGIATIYQENALFQGLSVAENIFIGGEITLPWRGIDHGEIIRSAARILEKLGAPMDPTQILAELGGAQQKIVEIARAFRQDARVIIMDEPSASFGHHEVDLLFRTVREVSKSGTAIIFISHHMEEVFELSDRITVLRDGESVATFDAADVTEADIIKLMVGRDVGQIFHHTPAVQDDTVLRISGLHGAGVRDVSFALNKGEVVAIAGLVGAGRSEVLGLIYGSLTKEAGNVEINGVRVDIGSPADALEHGICLITEDRKLDGLFLDHSYLDNFVVPSLDRYARPFIGWSHTRSDARSFKERLAIKVSDLSTRVSTLSGGNQQKAIIARWMNTNPDIYLFDEPTRGVDVGAKEEIYGELQTLVDAGKSVVLVSSELQEVIGLADRVFVMKDGAFVKELSNPGISQSQILEAAL